MNLEETYETLKADAVNSHKAYIETLEKSRFDDLKILNKRLLIFDVHIAAMRADVDLRDFVIRYIREHEF